MSNIEARFLPFYRSVVQRPLHWISAWVLLLLVSLLAVGMQTQWFKAIPFKNSPYMFFDEENPAYQDLRQMEGTYQSDKTLMILFEPHNGDVFSRESLSAIEEITTRAWELPHVVRVESLANFMHTEANGDELMTRPLYENAASLSDDEISAIQEIALNENALAGQLVSTSRRATVIVANVVLDDQQSQTPAILAEAYPMLENLREQYPFAEIRFLGDLPFNEASNMATMDTLTVTTPISMLLVLGLLFILLRSLWNVLAVQLIIGLAIVFAYLFFLLLGNALSPPAALSSPMILTLAVANCVHMLVTFNQQIGLGQTRQDAMFESLRINFQPIWITSITTAIGFLLMNFAESPPFRDLGNAVFLGMIMAFALSVTLLPALVVLLPTPQYRLSSQRTHYMDWLADFIIRNQTRLLATTSLFILVFLAFIPLNRVNDVFNEYFDHTYEVRRSLDLYLDEIGGLQRLQFNVPAQGENGVMEPEYLENLDKLIAWVENEPRVSHVRSFVEVVKRLHRNMHGGDETFYAVPDDRQLISQYVLLYELGLPLGLGLDSQLDINKSASKLEIVFNRIASDELIEERARINQWIKDNWPAYMQSSATGLDSLFGDISFDNVKSMLTGTVVALILISGLLVFTLKSPRYGALSLLPNLLPAAVAFGIWGLIRGEIGIVASVLGCMTLGIIVDDTVHFLSKYVRAKKEKQLDTEQATRYAFRTVGISLIATTVILVANFSVMSFSHYSPNVDMGVLTSMIITIALLLDFFFFVPILLKADKNA